MYEKIEQGKHIKKVNKIEVDAKDASLIAKKNEKKKKDKTLTVQQLNVEVKSNQ